MKVKVKSKKPLKKGTKIKIKIKPPRKKGYRMYS
jgi:hypothetical protein